MSSSEAYEVRLASAVTRQVRQLRPAQRERARASMKRQAAKSGLSAGSRGGKSLKQIRGRHGSFYRLRVGDLRIVFELNHDDRVMLVLAVVNRRDLERWLRTR